MRRICKLITIFPMKKKPLILSFALLLASCSCSGPRQSSSEVSTSSPASSIVIEENEMVDQIAYSASKYGSTKTVEQLSREIGGVSLKNSTRKDLLRLLRLAFDGLLPEVKGARRYQGDFGEGETSRKLSAEEKKDYDFLKEKGLIAEKYSPDDPVTMDEVKLLLKRIHYYIGGSEVDDFAATVNRDFLYDKDPADGATADQELIRNNLVSSEAIYQNVIKLAKEAVAEEGDTWDSFQYLIDAYESEETYNVADSAYACGLFDEIVAATDFASLWKVEQDLLAKTGSSNYLVHQSTKLADVTYQKRNIACDVSYVGLVDLIDALFGKSKGNYETFLAETGFDVEAYATTLLEPFGKAESVSDHAENLDKFLRGLLDSVKEYYEESEKWYLGAVEIVKENNDPFYVVTGDYSIGGLYDKTGYEFNGTVMNMTNLTALAYVAEASKSAENYDMLETYSLLGYCDRLYTAYALLNQFRPAAIASLLGYDLVNYYQGTDYYPVTLEKTRTLFKDLISTLKSNAVKNAWLSEEGIKALGTKADKMGHFLYAENNDVQMSYAKYFPAVFYEDTGKNVCAHNFSDFALHTDWIAKGFEGTLTYQTYLSLLMEPFTANAFYHLATNCIYITPGYLFSKGYDMSVFEEEEILAMFGLVVGHETTHGFDSHGCYFDGDGKATESSIFPADDLAAFEAKQQDVIALYDYEVMPGMMQKGETVLSEALADIGGLGLCLGIAATKEGFDYAKFYHALANNFMAACSRYSYETKYAPDVHPMGAARLNTLLMSKANFQETFNIQPGDGMYRDPTKEIVLW